MASSAFGIGRSTLDVDIVADIKPEQASDIAEYLRGEFYVDSDMILNAIQEHSSFNLIHLETLFKVDVFPLKPHPFDQQAFSPDTFKKPFQKMDHSNSFLPHPRTLFSIN